MVIEEVQQRVHVLAGLQGVSGNACGGSRSGQEDMIADIALGPVTPGTAA
ncbi:hypothetical protein [Streptomyces sp. NRRL B-3648]|nr:hypothetical protein [Streptomyces sp. NRRL B-3648]